MYLAGRGGLAGVGLTLEEFGKLGYKIIADPSTPLLAAFQAWQRVYAELADGFRARLPAAPEWGEAERGVMAAIGMDDMLRIERETVERD
jgi:2-methylisocitrate lyase-like PEP mutase family enzyme